jgi:hypothetical protein
VPDSLFFMVFCCFGGVLLQCYRVKCVIAGVEGYLFLENQPQCAQSMVCVCKSMQQAVRCLPSWRHLVGQASRRC